MYKLKKIVASRKNKSSIFFVISYLRDNFCISIYSQASVKYKYYIVAFHRGIDHLLRKIQSHSGNLQDCRSVKDNYSLTFMRIFIQNIIFFAIFLSKKLKPWSTWVCGIHAKNLTPFSSWETCMCMYLVWNNVMQVGHKDDID